MSLFISLQLLESFLYNFLYLFLLASLKLLIFFVCYKFDFIPVGEISTFSIHRVLCVRVRVCVCVCAYDSVDPHLNF